MTNKIMTRTFSLLFSRRILCFVGYGGGGGGGGGVCVCVCVCGGGGGVDGLISGTWTDLVLQWPFQFWVCGRNLPWQA